MCSIAIPRFILALGLTLASCSARLSEEGDTMPPAASCGSDADCPSHTLCVDNRCLPDHGMCAKDGDCLNDTYCACPPDIQASHCTCLPWGSKPRGDHDDMCAGQVFAPEEFKNPTLKCQWPPAGAMPSYKNSMSTPLVIDLDKDGHPEIVFIAGDRGDVHLIAMSGSDCTVKFDKQVNITPCTHLAVGDLDGDGFPEIVGLAPGVAVFDHNGDLKVNINTPSTLNCSPDYSPAIVNLDNTGPPEIVTGGQVSRYVAAPTPRIEVLWTKPGAAGGTWGPISLAEDLDGDGRAEVISSNQVFDGITGQDKTRSVMQGLKPGYAAIGDFNADHHPDIVLVSSDQDAQVVSIIDYFNNQFIMPPTPAPMGWGGPPTVADFDGDGKPEFATAGSRYYYVYSPDCLADPKPAKCHGTDPGVLWQSPNRDLSSGSTGSSVFDFNGDKVAEVVYRDECWLRVYNGPDGRKLFAAPVTSGTMIEMPVIADSDGDGHAEILVSANDDQGDRCSMDPKSSFELGIPHGPPNFGIKVYQDPMNRWMPSRSIWNQHSYHITNVNDDGTIPLKETPNIQMYNNYRQNVQGAVAGKMPTGDGTGVIIVPPDTDCQKQWRLTANICNRGAAPLPGGLPATFYKNDPRLPGATAICTLRTNAAIPVGKCQIGSCDWLMPPQEPQDLWLRINDDGHGGMPYPQCKLNNLAHLPASQCGGSGPG